MSLSPRMAKASYGAGSLRHRCCGTEAGGSGRGAGSGSRLQLVSQRVVVVGRSSASSPMWAEGGWPGLGARGPLTCGMGLQPDAGMTVRPQGTTTSPHEPGPCLRWLCSRHTGFVERLSDLRPGACSPEVPEPPPQVPASARLGQGWPLHLRERLPCLPVELVDAETSRLVPSMKAVFPAPSRAEMCCHGNCLANTPAGRGGKQQLRRLSE